MLKNSTTLKFLASTFVVAAFAFAFTASAIDFGSTTLKVGSKGEYVKTLQTLVGAIADGNFGPATKAKVATWQAANGLTVDGVFGKASMAKANANGSVSGNFPAGCTSASGFSTTTGQSCASVNANTFPAGCTSAAGFSPITGMSCAGSVATGNGSLSGSFGTISDLAQISSLSAEEVGAGQKDVQVLGFDATTSKDGDVGMSSIKLTFDASGNDSADSDRLTDYLSNVNVWMGSTKIGSSSTADFTKESTGVYSKTIQLSGAVIKADTTAKFYVSVDAVSNLDSGDIDSDAWSVAINNIRYIDGSGVTTTDSITDTDMANVNYATAGDGVAISFVNFSTAADTELKINISSDTPQAGLVTVKTATGADTNGVLLTKGTFKVEGTSNVWLDEVPFLFTTNATNVDDVTPTVYFTIDGTEYSESMTSSSGTTETITFNDLNKTLTAGKTYTFTVKADVNDIETTYFDEGDYLKAELTSTTRASIIAENSQGDQLTNSTEMTGVASGNIQYFYSISPVVTVVSKSIVANANGNSAPTSATAKMQLKVTAMGGTLYLNGDDATSNEFITLAVDGGDASSSVSSYTFTTSGTYTVTNSGAGEEYYTLNEGDSMYVDIEAVVSEATGSSAILVGMKGSAVLFGTASTSVATRAANSLSFTSLTDTLKTGKTTLDS